MFTDQDPSGDPQVAALLAAAGAPAESPLPGEAAALAAYRQVMGRGRLARRLGARPAQVVAGALFGGLVVAGGVATAATGSLPIVGHHDRPATSPHTPGDASPSPSGAATPGHASDAPGPAATGTGDTAGAGGHGVAPTPGSGSVEKGATTCTQASEGTCQAGQHGKAATAHTHVTPHPTDATHGPDGHGTASGHTGSRGRSATHPTPTSTPTPQSSHRER